MNLKHRTTILTIFVCCTQCGVWLTHNVSPSNTYSPVYSQHSVESASQTSCVCVCMCVSVCTTGIVVIQELTIHLF